MSAGTQLRYLVDELEARHASLDKTYAEWTSTVPKSVNLAFI